MATSGDSRRDNARYTDVNKEPDKPLPSLQKFPNKPVLPLREAVQPLQTLVDDLSAHVTLCLNKCKSPKDGLTQDQSAALYLYSLQWPDGQHSFYELFNRALRHENRTKVIPYYDYLHLFMTALGKLSCVQDRVWRGVNGNLSDRYQPKSVHVWWGVTSCSDMIHVTDKFLDQTQQRTLFNIKCYEGKIIKNHSAFPTESETVLAPGFCFRIKSISNPAPNFHIIDVEQIPYEEPVQEAASSSTTSSPVCLIWLDASVNTSEDNVKLQQKLGSLHSILETFENADQCEKFIRQSQKNSRLVFIVAGQVGRQIVPKIHDLSHLVAIYVYCMSKEVNEKWAKNHSKVKAVITQSQELIRQVERELAVHIEEVHSLEAHGQGIMDNLSDEPSSMMHSLLNSVQNQPLVSLEQAVEPLIDLIPDVRRMVFIAKERAEKPTDGLTIDESASITLYTIEWQPHEKSIYAVLNATLRSEDRSSLKSWVIYLKLILTALRKLPSVYRIVWRGVKQDLSNQYSHGSTHVWWAFTTTSSNASVLQSEHFLGKNGKRTMFCIECSSGKDIKRHSFFTNEDEILLMPGFTFRVESSLDAGNGLCIINVKEIPALNA